MHFINVAMQAWRFMAYDIHIRCLTIFTEFIVIFVSSKNRSASKWFSMKNTGALRTVKRRKINILTETIYCTHPLSRKKIRTNTPQVRIPSSCQNIASFCSCISSDNDVLPPLPGGEKKTLEEGREKKRIYVLLLFYYYFVMLYSLWIGKENPKELYVLVLPYPHRKNVWMCELVRLLWSEG